MFEHSEGPPDEWDEPARGGGAPAAEPLSEWAVPGVDRPQVVRPELLPSPAVALLAEAVDGLVAPDEGVSDAQVLVDTRAIWVALRRLEVTGLAWVAAVDRRRAFRAEGVASTARWAKAEALELEPRQLALARALGRFPAVAGQLGEGRLGLAAARQLQVALGRAAGHVDRPGGVIDGRPGDETLAAVLVDGVRGMVAQARGGFPTKDDPALVALLADLPVIAADTSRTQLQRLEAGLLVLAEHLPASQLPGALGLLLDALLPGLLQDRADRQHDRRRFALVRHPDGSGWTVPGELDLLCGERLFLLLKAELHRDPDAPLDTASAAALREQGLDPYDPDLPSSTSPRSTGQRYHDALSNGLERYLAADLGGRIGKDTVRIIVTVPLAALDRQPEALPAVSGSGTALPAALVAALACTSPLARHVLDLRGKVIEISHSARTCTATERAGLATQTGGHCQGAGCPRSTKNPDTVLSPHHATPHAQCGTTSLRDTVLLCTSCHHDVHDGRRRLLLKDGRRLGPDGWTG